MEWTGVKFEHDRTGKWWHALLDDGQREAVSEATARWLTSLQTTRRDAGGPFTRG